MMKKRRKREKNRFLKEILSVVRQYCGEILSNGRPLYDASYNSLDHYTMHRIMVGISSVHFEDEKSWKGYIKIL